MERTDRVDLARLLLARTLQTRRREDIDAVMRRRLEKARQGTGYAEIAIKIGSMLGRLDDAFAVADALFFGRGFDPDNLRYTAEQAIYTPRRNRRTHFPISPATRRNAHRSAIRAAGRANRPHTLLD